MELGTLGQFGFLTLPNYSLIACANAIEALRMANRVSARAAYKWQLLTLDGVPARASNGMSLQPTASLGTARAFDIVFVCGGVDIRRSTGRGVLSALRRLAREHVPLGALCTGSFALAGPACSRATVVPSIGKTWLRSARNFPTSSFSTISIRSIASALPAPAASRRWI